MKRNNAHHTFVRRICRGAVTIVVYFITSFSVHIVALITNYIFDLRNVPSNQSDLNQYGYI